jgi:hypothetical protein
VIGTSSTAVSGHIACHISRATSPCRRETPLAARLVRSANCVTPNGSAASSGFVRPSEMISSVPTPKVPAIWASVSATCCAGYVSLPAGTGVWVVKMVWRRPISSAADSEPLPL